MAWSENVSKCGGSLVKNLLQEKAKQKGRKRKRASGELDFDVPQAEVVKRQRLTSKDDVELNLDIQDKPVLKVPEKVENVTNPNLMQSQEMCVLLHQMILSNDDLKTNELVLSVVNQLRVSQNEIMSILETTNDEQAMASALAVNDAIVQILSGYEEVANGRMLREATEKDGEESDQLENPASPLFPDVGEDGAKKKKKKVTLSPPVAASGRMKSTDAKSEPGLLDDLLFSSSSSDQPTHTEDRAVGVKSDLILNEMRERVKAIALFQSIKDKTVCQLVKEEGNSDRHMAEIQKEVHKKVGSELYEFLRGKTIEDIIESDDATILKIIKENNEKLRLLIEQAVKDQVSRFVLFGVKRIKLGVLTDLASLLPARLAPKDLLREIQKQINETPFANTLNSLTVGKILSLGPFGLYKHIKSRGIPI